MDFTEKERLALEVFASDANLFGSILKIALKRLDTEKTLAVQKALLTKEGTNEQVGAQLRAVGDGIRLVEAIFREIGTYKKVQPKIGGKNPAR